MSIKRKTTILVLAWVPYDLFAFDWIEPWSQMTQWFWADHRTLELCVSWTLWALDGNWIP